MILPVVVVLLIVFGIGLPITLLIVPKMNPIGRLGISFPMGLGIFTLLMFISNLLGLRYSFTNILFLLFIPGIFLIFLRRNEVKKYLNEFWLSIRKSNLDLHEKVFIGATLLLIISSFISTLYWPVYTWDALTLYDFRAKVFVQSGFMKGITLSNYFLGYPPFTSLAHTIVYLAGGKNPQFIYSTFYLSIALSLYGLLRESVSRKVSLLFTFILLAVPQFFNQSIISYTNLPYTVFFSVGTIFYYVWDRARKPGFLIISAILIGLSAWTRSAEPLWIVIFLAVILASLFRKKLLDILIFSVFFFPIQQAWKIFQGSLTQMGNSTVSEVVDYAGYSSKIVDIDRWVEIFKYLNQNVLIPLGALFYAFVLAFLLSFMLKKQGKFIIIFIICFLLILMVLGGTYIISFTLNGWQEIGNSVTRMTMFFFPLFIYAIALLVGKNRD